MAEYIDRKRAKSEARILLRTSDVPAKRFFALYLVLAATLNLICTAVTGDSDTVALFSDLPGLFINILLSLASLIFGVGCYLYSFGIRRGERKEYLSLFDGFSFVGQIILLYVVKSVLLFFWFFPAFAVLLLAVSSVSAGGESLILTSSLLPMCLPLAVPGFIASYRYRFAILNLCENPSLGAWAAIRMSKLQTRGYKGQLFLLDMSYLGWAMLAYLPDILFNAYSVAALSLSAAGADALPSMPLGIIAQVLISSVFLLVIGVLYLPVYQSVELGYFETAKRTSGVGAGLTPVDDSQT